MTLAAIQTSHTDNELPVPAFYDAAKAADFNYSPDQQALFEAAIDWRHDQRIKASGADTLKLHLLLIDLQRDFCFPEGSLYVGGRSGKGALEDNDKIARFIYRNLGALSEVSCTMDTHFPYQIFFSSFWLTEDDEPVPAHTEIETEAIRKGAVKANPAVAHWLCSGNYTWLRKQVEFYCDELEKAGKYKLYLWPPHCLLGSSGHALSGVIHEARLFHSYVRGSHAPIEIKGGNVLTENYSILAPEVLSRHDGVALAQRNTNFIHTLLEADHVIIAGQAKSHCVRASVEDLLSEIQAKDPALAKKVYIREDCMSSVAVPDPNKHGAFLADFTDEADAAFSRFAAAGMNLVRSTDPIASWPGFGQ